MSENEFCLSSGERIPIIITTRRGLRNITLRPKTRPSREIHISKPWLTPTSAALLFLEQKRKWCERIFNNAPKKTNLKPNDEIEFLGNSVLLLHDESRRGNEFIKKTDGPCVLIVGGTIDMFERRIKDFIRSQFLISVKQMIHAVPREFWPRRIAVRDTSSRWGSCSTSGTMSFSWRLAFAPQDVMRYVVMHELAHQKHMDHSPAFWKQVSELYGFGVERAKRWLNVHGAELHKFF